MSNDKEIRSFEDAVEVRAAEDGSVTIEGYGAVFNSLSRDLGGFTEVIRHGAFRNALANGGDVRALVDHSDDKLLGRTSSGTLKLTEDEKGLRYKVTLPDTSYARDLRALMQRGDVNKSSFAFTVARDGEVWRNEGSKTIRELHNLNLYDVSVVTSQPAYEATSAAIRSYNEFKAAEQRQEPVVEVPEQKISEGADLVPNEEHNNDVARKRLSLIEKEL